MQLFHQRIQNICCKVSHQHLGVESIFVFGQHSSQSFGIIHVFRDFDFLHFVTGKEKMKNKISHNLFKTMVFCLPLYKCNSAILYYYRINILCSSYLKNVFDDGMHIRCRRLMVKMILLYCCHLY